MYFRFLYTSSCLAQFVVHPPLRTVSNLKDKKLPLLLPIHPPSEKCTYSGEGKYLFRDSSTTLSIIFRYKGVVMDFRLNEDETAYAVFQRDKLKKILIMEILIHHLTIVINHY